MCVWCSSTGLVTDLTNRLFFYFQLWAVSGVPAATSTRANSPTRVSPLTVHFCVSQFGWQQWFMKRASFPFGPASMIRSWHTTKLSHLLGVQFNLIIFVLTQLCCDCTILATWDMSNLWSLVFCIFWIFLFIDIFILYGYFIFALLPTFQCCCCATEINTLLSHLMYTAYIVLHILNIFKGSIFMTPLQLVQAVWYFPDLGQLSVFWWRTDVSDVCFLRKVTLSQLWNDF